MNRLLVVLVVAALSAAADDAPTRRETVAPPDHNCTIPVVGFTAFRGPELLKRGVRSARTRAVCRVVIVVNGHEDASVDAAVEELWAEGVADATTTQTVVVTLARNRGVSASWNEVIESTPNAEYWLICNSDVAFHNGTLDDIGPELALMLSGGDGMAIFGFPTRNGIQYGQIAFALAAKTRRAVGQFDENIFPAYYEDDEYTWRMHVAGLGIGLYKTHTVIHGEIGQDHYISGTMKATTDVDRFRQLQGRAFALNMLYVAQKWGRGVNDNALSWAAPNHGDPSARGPAFSRPFDDASLPLGYWRIDRGRRMWIETGRKRRAYVDVERSRAACAANPPQIVVFSPGAVSPDVRLFVALLRAAGIYVGNRQQHAGAGDSILRAGIDAVLGSLAERRAEKLVCHYKFQPVLENAGLPPSLVSAVARHNVNKPFATFDPLHGVAFAAYRQAFSNPVCVIVPGANPLDLPQNETRKRHLASWAMHVTAALRACADLTTVVVTHNELTREPKAAVEGLLRRLNREFCPGTESPPYYPETLDASAFANDTEYRARVSRRRRVEEARGSNEAAEFFVVHAFNRAFSYEWLRYKFVAFASLFLLTCLALVHFGVFKASNVTTRIAVIGGVLLVLFVASRGQLQMYELAQQKSARAEVQSRTKQLDTNSKKKLMMICHYLWRALEDRSACEWSEGKIPQIEGSQYCR